MFRYRTDDGRFCDLETYAAEVCVLQWDQGSELETRAALWLADQAVEYDTGAEGAWRDASHGVNSGAIGFLCYYNAQLDFFKKHEKEIKRRVQDWCMDSGQHLHEMFGDAWDPNDMWADGEDNQCLLARFGFEDALRSVACQSDLD